MINSRILKMKRIQLHERAENRMVFKQVTYFMTGICFLYWISIKLIEWYATNYYFINR